MKSRKGSHLNSQPLIRQTPFKRNRIIQRIIAVQGVQHNELVEVPIRRALTKGNHRPVRIAHEVITEEEGQLVEKRIFHARHVVEIVETVVEPHLTREVRGDTQDEVNLRNNNIEEVENPTHDHEKDIRMNDHRGNAKDQAERKAVNEDDRAIENEHQRKSFSTLSSIRLSRKSNLLTVNFLFSAT